MCDFVSCQHSGRDKHCKEGSMAAKVGACGIAKRSPREVRNKQGTLKEAVLNYPDQLDTHSLETTTGEMHVAYLI